jgi:hypothetical protein
VQERFLWHFPYLERIQGVLDGVPRGPVGPLGPLELAALLKTELADAALARAEDKEVRDRLHHCSKKGVRLA